MSRLVNLCFSGGRTSAYMTENILYLQTQGLFLDIKFVITFANTGREHEETLKFVNLCDERWRKLYKNIVIWLEAKVFHGAGIHTSFTTTTFKKASREGEPFEEVVKKYGIPNGNFLHCTRELKENPIRDLMSAYGGKSGYTKNKVFIPASYETWIGIREDEPKRLVGNKNGKQLKRYPLGEFDPLVDDVDLRCDKQDVLDFWDIMPFNLRIPEHLGNCIDCHKKSASKLKKVMRDMGEQVFEFPLKLDTTYSHISPQIVKGKEIIRKRYRGYQNTSELITMLKISDFDLKDRDDESGGCSESCDPFMEDNKL